MPFKNEFQRAVDNTVAMLKAGEKKAQRANPVPFRSKPDPLEEVRKSLGLDAARIRRTPRGE